MPSIGSVFISVEGSKVCAGDLIILSSISDTTSTLGWISSISGGSAFIRRLYFLFCRVVSGVVLSVLIGDGGTVVGEG